MAKALAITLASTLAVFLVVAACNEDGPPCYAGDYIACTCANGAAGYAACQPGEGLYVPCICDGTIPGLKSAPGDAAAEAEASAKTTGNFLDPCTKNEDCKSGLCQDYPGKGQQLCSSTCKQTSAATDCPPPSTGCNNQGVCKAP